MRLRRWLTWRRVVVVAAVIIAGCLLGFTTAKVIQQDRQVQALQSIRGELQGEVRALANQVVSLGEEPVVEPAAGVDGRDGFDGLDGLNGLDGRDGQDGRDGRDGSAGEPGPPGPAGPAGADGLNGANGLDGATGATGATGETGATGPQGPAGADGADGPACPDGYAPAVIDQGPFAGWVACAPQ
jgi:outer membrane murein-binding lipoprotein Lpp